MPSRRPFGQSDVGVGVGDAWTAGLRKRAARSVFGAGAAKAALAAVAVVDVGLGSAAIVDGETSAGAAAGLAALALAAHVARASERGEAYDLVVASAVQAPAGAADDAVAAEAETRAWTPLGRLLSDAWDLLPKRVLLLAVTLAGDCR